MATVFIVDDDESVRRSLARLLRANGLASEAFPSAEAFLAHERAPGTACLLLDVNMTGMSGIELQRKLDRRGSELPIVFLTGHGDVPMSVEAMKRGAIDFLLKPVDSSDLLEAVHSALDHHRTLLESSDLRASIERRMAMLTPREREVMDILITGAPNKIVADQLDIALKTVKVHRAHIMEKMGVRSVAALLHLCHLVGREPDLPGDA